MDNATLFITDDDIRVKLCRQINEIDCEGVENDTSSESDNEIIWNDDVVPDDEALSDDMIVDKDEHQQENKRNFLLGRDMETIVSGRIDEKQTYIRRYAEVELKIAPSIHDKF